MDKLLFIDDEEGIRRSVVRALKNEPYETYTAENGRTTERTTKQKKCNVGSTQVKKIKNMSIFAKKTILKLGASAKI